MEGHEHESAAVPVHVAEQYEAGYSARFREEPYSLGAARSWQSGWHDASRELGRLEEAFSQAPSPLRFFGTGEEARRRELPFDPTCSEEWKRSWIQADIRLGLEPYSLRTAKGRLSRNSDESDGEGGPTRDALPVRPGKHAGAWYVLDLLHAPAPG